MEYVLKLTIICVISSLFSLLLKKTQPESAFLLGTCSVIFSTFCVLEIFQQIRDQFDQWKTILCFTSEYFTPLFKCLGISIVSNLGVGLCKDAGQSAAASCLELCANFAAIWCMLPLINHLFSIIEDLI